MILEIDGQEVEVDDSFDKLTPEQQNATVDEIAASLRASKPAQQPETQLGADRRMADDALVAEQTAIGRREAYNQLPEWQKPIQALDDGARLIGNPFGVGDKFAARMNSLTGDLSYEDQLRIEKNRTQAARDRAGTAAIPSEIMGDVLAGGAIAGQGATLAGRFNTANMAGWRGLMARAGLMAPEGALYGVADALGRDTDLKTAAVTGAIAGPVGSVVGDTVSKVASKILPAKTASKLPSLEALEKQADEAYKASDRAGVMIKPDVAKSIIANAQQKLTQFGYHPKNHPGVEVALEELDRISKGNFTLKGIDTARQVARSGYNPSNPKNNEALGIVVDEIDAAINKLGSKDLIMGNAKDGVNSLLKARETWTRLKKNERLMDAVESARYRARTSGTGGNEENAIRQELRRFIDPKIKNRPKNWTPDEADAIKSIVNGTIGQNTLRLLGRMSPSTGGLNIMMHLLGASATSGATIPFAAAGAGAKFMADRGVRQGVQALDELIRAGGSQAQLKAAQATLRSLSQSQREAIARIVQTALIQAKTRSEAPAQ